MRPFRRRATVTEGSRSAPPVAAVGPAGAGPVISRTAENRPAWRDVPAMGSSFGPPDLTLATDSFRAGLAAHAAPHPFLAPLGHLVSADGPSGIVTGLAQPIATVARSVEIRGDGAELPVRQRSSVRSANGNGAVVQRWPARNGWGPPMVTASTVEAPSLAFDAVETPAEAEPALVSWNPDPDAEPEPTTTTTTNGAHPVADVASPPVASRLAQSSWSPPPPEGGGSTTPASPLPPSTNGHPVAAEDLPVGGGGNGRAARLPEPPGDVPPVAARTPEWAPETPAPAGPAVSSANSYLPRTESTSEPPVQRRVGPVPSGPGPSGDIELAGSTSPSPMESRVVAWSAPFDRVATPPSARPLVGPRPPDATTPATDAIARPTVGPVPFEALPSAPTAAPPVARTAATTTPAGSLAVAPAHTGEIPEAVRPPASTPTAPDAAPPPVSAADPAESTDLPVVHSLAPDLPVARAVTADPETTPAASADAPPTTATEPEMVATLGADPGPAAPGAKATSEVASAPEPGLAAGAGPVAPRSADRDAAAGPDAGPGNPGREQSDPVAGPLTAPLVARAAAADEGGGTTTGLPGERSEGPVPSPSAARSVLGGGASARRWNDSSAEDVTAPLVGRSTAPDPAARTTDRAPGAPPAGSNVGPLVARTIAAPEPATRTTGRTPDGPSADSSVVPLVARTIGAEPGSGTHPRPVERSSGPEPGGEAVLSGWSHPRATPIPTQSVTRSTDTALGDGSTVPVRADADSGSAALPVVARTIGSDPGGPHPALGAGPEPAAAAARAVPDEALAAPAVGRVGPPERDAATIGSGGSLTLAGPLAGAVVSRSAAPEPDAGTPDAEGIGLRDRPVTGPVTAPLVGRSATPGSDPGTPPSAAIGPVTSAFAAPLVSEPPAPAVPLTAPVVARVATGAPGAPLVGHSAAPDHHPAGPVGTLPAADPVVVPTLGPETGLSPAAPGREATHGDVTAGLVVSRAVGLDPGVALATPATARSLGLGLGLGLGVGGPPPAQKPDVQRASGLLPSPPRADLVDRPVVGATSLVGPSVPPLAGDAPLSRTPAPGAADEGQRALSIPVVARLATTGSRADDDNRQTPPITALVGGQPMDPAPSWPPLLGLGQPLVGDGLPPLAPTAATPRPAAPTPIRMPVVQSSGQSRAAPVSDSEPGSAGHAREVIAAALAAGGTAAPDGSITFAPPGGSSTTNVQRATVSDPPAQAATPPVTRTASAPSPSAEPGEDDRASTDLDLLASQLYDRMLFRLRRDLRHELERKGQHVHLRRS